MDHAGYLDHLRRESDLLARAAGKGLEPAVPACPGWQVRDVVTHVAEVYEHKIACTLLGARPDPWPPEWPGDRDPRSWFDDARGRLLDLLTQRGPEAPSWTWWPPDQTVGFWARRMTQETLVHRVDAESPFGDVGGIDADLATDGIDEVLTIFLAGDWSEAPEKEARGQRVAVEAAGRAWVVTLEPTLIDVGSAGDGEAPAGATVSGSSPDVLLWLWGRAPDAAVRLDGDLAATALLRRRLVLATQ